jgi:hypothetical protein
MSTSAVAARTRPGHKDWQNGRGHAARRDWAAAARAFARATRVAPSDTLYWLNLANAERRAGAHERADGAEPDLELVYKRVPVSLSPTPNHNPTITGWRVDGEPWSEGEGPLPVRSGATLSIEPILSADSLEAYTYENTAGEVEDREEEPFFTWFTEAGDFDQALSLYPEVAVEWTAPEALDTEALIVAVARDRRGGMAWRTLQVVVQ